MPTSRQSTGQYGETLAARHLQQQGYTIHGRNWRCQGGELDIIAHDGTEWVFVEVRTRRAPTTNPALESITPAKQAHLLTAIQAYRAAHELEEQPWRLDLVVIALLSRPPHIEVIHDVAGW